MKENLAVLGLAALLAGGAGAQALTEHAAAAAGAAIGTAGGKILSNVIDKNLSQAAEAASQSGAPSAKPASHSQPKAPKPDPQAMRAAGLGLHASPPAPETASEPVRAPRAARRAPDRVIIADPGYRAQRAASYYVPPIPPAPKPQDFARVKEGESSANVVAILGTPSSRVIIPEDDGHLTEILSWSDKTERVGTVHVDNGKVVSVAHLP